MRLAVILILILTLVLAFDTELAMLVASVRRSRTVWIVDALEGTTPGLGVAGGAQRAVLFDSALDAAM